MIHRLHSISSPREAAFLGLVAWAPLNAIAYPFLRVGDPAWITFDRIWIIVLGVWVVFDLRRERLRSRAADVAVVAAAVLVVTFGIRALLTPDDRLTVMKVWLDAIVLPVILLVAARQLITDIREWRILVGALAVAGTVLSLIGFAEFAFDFELASRSGGVPFYDSAIDMVRVSGPYAATEVFAVSLLVCYAATLCWMQLRGVGWLTPWTAMALLQLGAIGITFFRAAWIAALLITLCALAARVRSRPRPAVALAVVAALVGLGFGLTRFDAVSTRLSDSDNVTGRLATWGQDLNVFGTAPVFGVGVERFRSATTPETDVVISGVKALDQPHSSYLGLLAEQGVVGFIPFAVLTVAVWWLVRTLGRASRTDDERTIWACIAGAGLAYLITSLTLTMLPYGVANGFFAVLVGAAAGVLDEMRRDDWLPPSDRLGS